MSKRVRLTRPSVCQGLLFLLWIPIGTGCSGKVENDPNAYYAKAGDHYVIVMKGERSPMVHDLLSVFLAKTYTKTEVLEVPRITGIVKASELPSKKEGYARTGQIAFRDKKMNVDLYFENTDDDRRDPSEWNGEYSLIPFSDSENAQP